MCNRAVLAAWFVAACGLASGAIAGDLNPPAGPVAPTMKDLKTVEPRTPISAATTPGDADSLFRITAPGSYYLTANVSGVAAKGGIEIASGGVTLDLMGFDLLGVAGSLDGIFTSGSLPTDVIVYNGSVRSWGGDGVDLSGALNPRLDGITASQNTGAGLRAGGNYIILGCAANQNTDGGFACGAVGVISDCSCRNNTGSGFATAASVSYRGCTSSGNSGHGFSVSTGTSLVGCSSANNAQAGFATGFGCVLTSCSAQANTTNGITVSTGCTVQSCTSAFNTGAGISAAGYATIIDNAATFNSLDGIVSSSVAGGIIRGNGCFNNGNGISSGAGIHVTQPRHTIDQNTCNNNDRGIDVDISGNFITRNTSGGNTTNWDIAANNVVGPILDRTAPASAAILGNSAPSSLGTAEPNANFTY